MNDVWNNIRSDLRAINLEFYSHLIMHRNRWHNYYSQPEPKVGCSSADVWIDFTHNITSFLSQGWNLH